MSLSCPEARKDQQFWSEMRTNYRLISRAFEIKFGSPDNVQLVMQSQLRDILETGNLIYPDCMTQLGLTPEMSLSEKKSFLDLCFGTLARTELEEKFLDMMADRAEATRQANWAWRIAEEAELKDKQDWYPFFVTLTVDPKAYDPEEVFRGRALTEYYRDLANVVCEVMGHPPVQHTTKAFPNYRSVSDYVVHAGVIEHGKSREHHHCHLLIWMRDIPARWKLDPNHGRQPHRCTENECTPMRVHWKYSAISLSPCNYFRTVNDIWHRKHHFVTPLVKNKKTRKFEPLDLKPARTAGFYVTKYLSKEFKEWQHRMKATRNLGMHRLHQVLWNLQPKEVEALSWKPRSSALNHSVMKIHSVPLGLLRYASKTQHYWHQWQTKSLDIHQQLQSNFDSFSRMLRSARDGTRPDRMPLPEFYDWAVQFLPEPDGYCEDRLLIAHAKLAHYFPPGKSRHKHTSQGGQNIGHT